MYGLKGIIGSRSNASENPKGLVALLAGDFNRIIHDFRGKISQIIDIIKNLKYVLIDIFLYGFSNQFHPASIGPKLAWRAQGPAGFNEG
jgi:hypothetical protein